MVRQIQGVWFCQCLWPFRRCLFAYRGLAPVRACGPATG
ncbi:UNVERIFIED_CONTAM: hypothetical protein GTU68_060270 [Idotea baltica]|nr:hypothetical protein [Idotea baltica]